VEWLTIQEAAEPLRVRVSWLYERTRTNTIPHAKLGKYLRFDRDERIGWVGEFRRDGGRAGRATRPSGGLSGIRRRLPVPGRLSASLTVSPHVRELIKTLLAKKLAPASVLKVVALVKGMFKHAVQWGYLDANPAQYVERPRVEVEEMDILTPPETHRKAALARLPSRFKGEMVFTSTDGQPIDPDNFRHRDWAGAAPVEAPADPVSRPSTTRTCSSPGRSCRWSSCRARPSTRCATTTMTGSCATVSVVRP